MKTINHIGDPYYEINEPRPLELDEIDFSEIEKELQFVSSQIYESFGIAFDDAIRDGFTLYGMDRWVAQRLLRSGRLKLLTGGIVPQLTALAVLDGEDLFAVKTSERFDSGRNACSVNIDFIPLKKLEVSGDD